MEGAVVLLRVPSLLLFVVGSRRAGRWKSEGYSHYARGGGGDGEGPDQATDNQQACGVEAVAALTSQQHREGDPAPEQTCQG